jgi:hypothetical protein
LREAGVWGFASFAAYLARFFSAVE